MPLFDKLPATGDRVVVLLGRGQPTTGSRQPAVATPITEGSGYRGHPEFILAEALLTEQGTVNYGRTPTNYDYATVRYQDPDVTTVSGINIYTKTCVYTHDIFSQAINRIHLSQMYGNGAKAFLSRFLYPQVVADGDYARLIRDITGRSELPASAAALLHEVREQAAHYGIRWLEFGATASYATTLAGGDNQSNIEALYESYNRGWTEADNTNVVSPAPATLSSATWIMPERWPGNTTLTSDHAADTVAYVPRDPSPEVNEDDDDGFDDFGDADEDSEGEI